MRTHLYVMLLLAVPLFGCSHSRYEIEKIRLPKNTKIAVVPFENLTSYPRAGNIVSEIMTIYIHQGQDFRIIESKQKVEVKKGQTRNLRSIGQALQVNYVLSGTVSEYRYTKGLAEVPSVAIQAKLLNVKTGKVVWRASASDMSKESFFKRSASLNELTHTMSDEMISYLKVQ